MLIVFAIWDTEPFWAMRPTKIKSKAVQWKCRTEKWERIRSSSYFQGEEKSCSFLNYSNLGSIKCPRSKVQRVRQEPDWVQCYFLLLSCFKVTLSFDICLVFATIALIFSYQWVSHLYSTLYPQTVLLKAWVTPSLIRWMAAYYALYIKYI